MVSVLLSFPLSSDPLTFACWEAEVCFTTMSQVPGAGTESVDGVDHPIIRTPGSDTGTPLEHPWKNHKFSKGRMETCQVSKLVVVNTFDSWTSITNLQDSDLEPLFWEMIWVPFCIESAGCLICSSSLVFACVILFDFCLPLEFVRRLYSNLSTSLELLAPGTREGPLLHVQFWSCDLPASLEDIESQCQVMSIVKMCFSSVQCCRGFSIAIRGILEHQWTCEMRIISHEISASFTSTDLHLLHKVHTRLRHRIQSWRSEKLFARIENEFWTHNLWNDFFVFSANAVVDASWSSFCHFEVSESKDFTRMLRRWSRSTCGCLIQHEVPTEWIKRSNRGKSSFKVF